MITMKVKATFFDRAIVRKMVSDKNRAALSRAGAFVRTRAKSSIRKRKAISSPGAPPSSHAGHLKRLIWFAYERSSESVVVGPLRFQGGSAPPLLEFGGQATLRRKGKNVRATFRPRPFMGPALEQERPKLASHWASSVKGA